MKYQVKLLKDDIYQVFEKYDEYVPEVVHQGSLESCYAFVKSKEEYYL